MGTHVIVQKRGKGGPSYRTPKHRFISPAKYPQYKGEIFGEVTGFAQDPSKDVLLAEVLLSDDRPVHLLAAEGLKVGDVIHLGGRTPLCTGSICFLEFVPEGISVFNVESRPFDGGKFARASGAFATVVGRDEDSGEVNVQLASKRVIRLEKSCRATVGIASGGGRLEKPLKKAGAGKMKAEARNKRWPTSRGTAMSAYDHPHGGKSFGKSSCVSRNAPPGQKVGHIAASRTGRRRGKVVTVKGEK
ncbi:MAG: 50S ribosomal protein L2 [Candidatus Micrarchaeota archaeon]